MMERDFVKKGKKKNTQEVLKDLKNMNINKLKAGNVKVNTKKIF